VLFWKLRSEEGREKVLICFVKATGFGVAESFSFFFFFWVMGLLQVTKLLSLLQLLSMPLLVNEKNYAFREFVGVKKLAQSGESIESSFFSKAAAGQSGFLRMTKILEASFATA
jgi:hypothetical protein